MGLFHQGLTGILPVSNFDEVRAFYEDRLGLVKTQEWTDREGNRRARYSVTGGGFIELHENDRTLPQGPTSFWMEAADINGLYSTLQKIGGMDLFDPIEDKYFHARSFQMRDPAGNATFVVAYEKNVRPYTKDSVKGAFFKDEFRTVLFVDDLDATYDFYTTVLEMPCVYQWNECAGDKGFKYHAAGTEAYIENLHRIPLTKQGFATIKLYAVDFDACYEKLSANPKAHMIRPLYTNELGAREFVLEDPDGNYILICE